MRKTKTNTFDLEVLKNRLAVTDAELAALLGCGLVTARRIAQAAGASFKIGGRRLNKTDTVLTFIDKLSDQGNV